MPATQPCHDTQLSAARCYDPIGQHNIYLHPIGEEKCRHQIGIMKEIMKLKIVSSSLNLSQSHGNDSCKHFLIERRDVSILTFLVYISHISYKYLHIIECGKNHTYNI